MPILGHQNSKFNSDPYMAKTISFFRISDMTKTLKFGHCVKNYERSFRDQIRKIDWYHEDKSVENGYD